MDKNPYLVSMIILITGSRKLEPETIKPRLKEELEKHPATTTLLHGGAQGADQAAEEVAKELGLKTEVIKPDYQTYHYKLAPLKRNSELVAKCDHVIALYAPNRIRQGGTWDTVQKAIAANKPVTELLPDGQRTERPRTTTLW